jgi:hypothetical protein
VYRVAQRSQAVVLNSQGRASGESAEILRAPRSKVSEWVARYQAHGVEGSLESHRSGRPAQLTAMQRPQLGDTLDSSVCGSTRQNGTHRRYFSDSGALVCIITRVFTEMRSHPELIRPCLCSFISFCLCAYL